MSRRVRILAGATAAVCWIGLVLQFVLVVHATQALAAAGGLQFPIPAALAVFLSFLTLQVTLLLGMTTSRAALNLGMASTRFFSALATYVIAGTIIFCVALQPYWHHAGTQFLADVLLHGFVPALYLAFWLTIPKHGLTWHNPFRWLLYPLIYLALLLIAAHWTGFYPYPFVDMRVLPLWSLAFNVVAITVTFLSCGFAVVLISRMSAPDA